MRPGVGEMVVSMVEEVEKLRGLRWLSG